LSQEMEPVVQYTVSWLLLLVFVFTDSSKSIDSDCFTHVLLELNFIFD
jgi:hypothetical protein